MSIDTSPEALPESPQTRIARLVAALWEKNEPQVLERLALLDAAAAALTEKALDSELQEEATQTAHKLAGTLGMFGHPEATETARFLEQAYDQADPDAAQIRELTTRLRSQLKL